MEVRSSKGYDIYIGIDPCDANLSNNFTSGVY